MKPDLANLHLKTLFFSLKANGSFSPRLLKTSHKDTVRAVALIHQRILFVDFFNRKNIIACAKVRKKSFQSRVTDLAYNNFEDLT
ncbi:hypothetical protein BpHYR1_031383 [Brachionus plicatilis]|uniref:Uncharacterized protein n=1 Tax=Brachionus plicatilis TaxID=10195 RepID=A0A3M7STW7_BRAPC|nr:hypothetical protein BpHYR1_031383 [Brachionus plicatilis]